MVLLQCTPQKNIILIKTKEYHEGCDEAFHVAGREPLLNPILSMPGFSDSGLPVTGFAVWP